MTGEEFMREPDANLIFMGNSSRFLQFTSLLAKSRISVFLVSTKGNPLVTRIVAVKEFRIDRKN